MTTPPGLRQVAPGEYELPIGTRKGMRVPARTVCSAMRHALKEKSMRVSSSGPHDGFHWYAALGGDPLQRPTPARQSQHDGSRQLQLK